MPTENGIVEKISKGKALVRIQKSSACAGCTARDSCEVTADKQVLIEVSNSVNAEPGNLVEISIPAGTLLKLSLIIYMIPVICLIIGAFAGGIWAQSSGTESSLGAISGAAIAIAASFLVIRRLDRSVWAGKEYRPGITRILLNGTPPG